MKINNPNLALAIKPVMSQQVLRLRLAGLQLLEDKMARLKPKTPYGHGKWLSDINQIERLIHQTQEFIETREVQDV